MLMRIVLERLGEREKKILSDPEQQCTLNGVDGFELKLTEEKWLQQIAHAGALNGFLIGLKGYN